MEGQKTLLVLAVRVELEDAFVEAIEKAFQKLALKENGLLLIEV